MMLVRSLLAYFPCVVVCLAVTQPLTLLAQYQKYDGKEVLTIQFDPVVQPVDPSELYEILPLKIHQPLTMASVRASIERLFATGRYADIQVDAEPYQNGVIVRFLTKNSWFIGSVSAVGSLSNPNPEQLENATRLDLGQPYTEAKLREAVAGQQRLLESNGLYRSGIHPVLDYDRVHQQVNLRFEVDAGRRAHFASPVPTGDLKMDPAKIEPILLANLSDWSGLFALDPHTRAEPGFSLALFESAQPGFIRDYNRWISRPNRKHETALLKHFGPSPPRFVLARRERISSFLPFPELYVPLFFDSQYGLLELASGTAPVSAPAISKLSGDEISAAWKLFRKEAVTWAWPAEFLCVEGVSDGQKPSSGKACWRRMENKAVLILDERNGARAGALKIHLLRALPGNNTAAAALEPGIRGTRALLLPFPLAGTKLFLGDELLFLPPPFSEEPNANWQAALPLSQESYFSPRESEAHPYTLGMILDRPASAGELTAGFELAAAFLAHQVGPDGELLYHRSLLSAGQDSAGGAEGSVRLNHAAYVLCLSPGAARGRPLRETLLEACNRAVTQRLAAGGPLEKQSLGELATLGLALLARGGPQHQETLSGIETEILRRFGQGKFQISRAEDEVFFPGEAAVFLSLLSSPASQKALAESIPYYRSLFRTGKQPHFLVRWFGEAMLRLYDRSGNREALAFLEEILRFTEEIQAAAPKLPWMDGCLAGPPLFKPNSSPYPYHLAGLFLEGLALPSRRNSALAERQRRVAQGLALCSLRQQLREWNLANVARPEGSLGTWRFGLNSPDSRIDVHSHVQLGLQRAVEMARPHL